MARGNRLNDMTFQKEVKDELEPEFEGLSTSGFFIGAGYEGDRYDDDAEAQPESRAEVWAREDEQVEAVESALGMSGGATPRQFDYEKREEDDKTIFDVML